MSYDEYVPGAYYGLKDRAPQKRYLVRVLGLRLLHNAVCAYSPALALLASVISLSCPKSPQS
jgi:hypothetical protein